MRKPAIRNGDPTTTGGFVIAFSSTIRDDGRQIALHGDEATCGNCKGAYKMHGTGEGMSEKGRCVVVEGDMVLCPCKKNRVIVGKNPGIWLEVEGGTGRGHEPNTNSVRSSVVFASTQFDEQIRAATQFGTPEGYPYFIEAADGRTFFGRVDANGELPRVNTEASENYTVFWGDEALEKSNES